MQETCLKNITNRQEPKMTKIFLALPFMGVRDKDGRSTHDATVDLSLQLLVDDYHMVGIQLDGVLHCNIVHLKTVHKHL